MGISSVGSSHRNVPERIERTQSAETAKPAAPGNNGHSADSVGHQAKSNIAVAENTDLPRNIQGKVASAIARNIDFTALLAVEETDTRPENDMNEVDPIAAEVAPTMEEITPPLVEGVPTPEDVTDGLADCHLKLQPTRKSDSA